MKKRVICVLSIIMVLSLTALLAGCKYRYPDSNKRIDLDSMTLVMEDNFDSLNLDLWSLDDCVRRGGYWDSGQVSVRDGNMVITTKYHEDGQFGAGWYTGSARTIGKFEVSSGYVEARCKMPKSTGMWSAFWMQSPDMKADGKGTEIDIVESPHWLDESNPDWYKNKAFHTIHAYGYGDEHKSKMSPYYEVEPNMYDNYNTYGVYWDENGYTFYVNGMQTWHTTFVPSQSPEYLWLSVEIAGAPDSGNPSNPDNEFTWAGEIEDNGRDHVSEFLVDYVRYYQVK